ncbi:MAG TPA: DUF4838 domain-containing protein [Candidatus Hydrogenedentes bacterium]|nr:DUF4838 domain-containing protein [Candidatus Hydrogenedentota bacterium]HPG65246.1 DUF4838 domain-containing protein [Candidatus Hydrogenedentota bacterium]
MAIRIGLATVLALLAASAAGALVLAQEGRAQVAIVLGADPTACEQTAAVELAAYLGRITGGTFQTYTDPNFQGTAIYVGQTAYARDHGIEVQQLEAEEWIIRSTADALILTGGRPRGTLYAAYRFLEDVAGVHWWNPFEEYVPSKPTFAVEPLDRRGKPTFRYRDIYMLYGNDNGRFAARNRLNRDGDAPIAAEFGGEMAYGPPYHVHTFYMYVPPEQYFDEHPEWFSLVKGERSHDHKQLCLTNPELRQFMVDKLKTYIEQSRADAAEAGKPAPLVYSISQNDWYGTCQCPACQALVDAEGCQAGPLLDFVNHIADAIAPGYPEICIDTLAYQMTQETPKTIKPRDNVIVRLCDTRSNFTKPITDPENEAFRNILTDWCRITKRLRIWDYAVTYGPFYGLPLASVYTYADDYRFYAEHNVEGVFTEHEYPILADWRDLKVWMMMKLLEDPYRDCDALVHTFLDGFYGPAGPYLRQYLDALGAASIEKSSYLSMSASPRQYRYLDLRFLTEAQHLFDTAELAAGDDAVLLRRVRFARLPLDRATVILFEGLMREWVQAGNEPSAFPLNREAVANRYRASWHTEIDLRIPEGQRAAERTEADNEVQRLLSLPAYVSMPKRFKDRMPGDVFVYSPLAARNWQDQAKPVADPSAESGFADRLELSDEDMAKYALPMSWGLYDVDAEKTIGSATIKADEVSEPGYHWFKLGELAIPRASYVYFFWSWIIQFDVGDVVDAGAPDRRFEIWACIKFEGPGFPHGRASEANAISVERLVLAACPS